MKSEKGNIATIIISIITIIIIVVIMSIVIISIKENIDYGIQEGQVIDKRYNSAYTTTTSTGNITIPQYHPERYNIKIQKDIDGKAKSIWVTVDKDTYHNIKVGDYYNGM